MQRVPVIPILLAFVLPATACMLESDDPPNDDERTAVEQLALRSALAVAFAERDSLLHGVAGDERLVFVAEAFVGRVAALSRFTGREVAELPAPPGGFGLPFALRVPAPGRLVVLDAGGFPPMAPPSVHEYDYSYDWRHRQLEATLVRSVSFAGLPVAFVEDVEVLPDGRYVVSDSVLGSLWVVHPDGTIAPGIFPASFAPEDAVPGLAPCLLPEGVVVGGLPFATAGQFAPGVGSLAARDGWLYFGSSCLGGVRRVPVASLEDPTRLPHERGADIEVVSPRPEGVPAESLKGLTFNRWSDDDRLFATDALGFGVMRIDVHTGAREPLVYDDVLFHFPVAAQYLPPVLGITPVVVVSDQEHRLAALNAAIPEDMLLPPFVVTKVYTAP